MSCQKGNNNRTRAQKHQNRSAFKNNMHDTSKLTKVINNLQVGGCCSRCKEIIEWKIKYKKYKPLTVPKKCVKCCQKVVKRAYYIMCQPCAESQNICAKCGQKSEDIQPQSLTEEEMARQESQLAAELKLLPERKRRTFLRQQESGQKADAAGATAPSGPTGDADDSDMCESEPESNCIDYNDVEESSDGEISRDKEHKKVTFWKSPSDNNINEVKDIDEESKSTDFALTHDLEKTDLTDNSHQDTTDIEESNVYG